MHYFWYQVENEHLLILRVFGTNSNYTRHYLLYPSLITITVLSVYNFYVAMCQIQRFKFKTIYYSIWGLYIYFQNKTSSVIIFQMKLLFILLFIIKFKYFQKKKGIIWIKLVQILSTLETSMVVSFFLDQVIYKRFWALAQSNVKKDV